MRRITWVLLVACSGSDDSAPSCEDMQRAITQRHGVCIMPRDPVFVCPDVVNAYCGAAASCPDGWLLSCLGDPGVECTYGSTCTIMQDTVDLGQIQTLNGVDGLIIRDPNMTDSCSFQPCL